MMLACLALLLTIGMFAHRQARHSSGQLTPPGVIGGIEDDLPENIRNTLECIGGKIHSRPDHDSLYVELSNKIRDIDSDESRRDAAYACAKWFLSLKLENGTIDMVKNVAFQYYRYILYIDRILRETNVDGAARIDFLFDALAIYREYCCRPIPGESAITDFHEWNSWANTMYGVRWDLLDNLEQFERDFDWIFRGFDAKTRVDVVRRLLDFHLETVKEVERMDKYQRAHKRRSPKMLCSYPVNYERLNRNLPQNIHIGDNEIDIRKWEAGRKDEIIAEILSGRNKSKGAVERRSDEVEIRLDGTN